MAEEDGEHERYHPGLAMVESIPCEQRNDEERRHVRRHVEVVEGEVPLPVAVVVVPDSVGRDELPRPGRCTRPAGTFLDKECVLVHGQERTQGPNDCRMQVPSIGETRRSTG